MITHGYAYFVFYDIFRGLSRAFGGIIPGEAVYSTVTVTTISGVVV